MRVPFGLFFSRLLVDAPDKPWLHFFPKNNLGAWEFLSVRSPPYEGAPPFILSPSDAPFFSQSSMTSLGRILSFESSFPRLLTRFFLPLGPFPPRERVSREGKRACSSSLTIFAPPLYHFRPFPTPEGKVGLAPPLVFGVF